MTKRLSMKGWAIMLVALMTMVFATALLGSASIERAHAEDAPVESPEEPPVESPAVPPVAGPKEEKGKTHSPTSKDQCKKGGYKHFGFKNQGQCISSLQKH